MRRTHIIAINSVAYEIVTKQHYTKCVGYSSSSITERRGKTSASVLLIISLEKKTNRQEKKHVSKTYENVYSFCLFILGLVVHLANTINILLSCVRDYDMLKRLISLT